MAQHSVFPIAQILPSTSKKTLSVLQKAYLQISAWQVTPQDW